MLFSTARLAVLDAARLFVLHPPAIDLSATLLLHFASSSASAPVGTLSIYRLELHWYIG